MVATSSLVEIIAKWRCGGKAKLVMEGKEESEELGWGGW